MNDLRELIGQTVTATIGKDDKGCDVEISCKIIYLDINDYYFEDKQEPIYVTVNVEPIGKLPKGFNYENLSDIPLCNIRK
jgi:hypothetical protein